MVDGSFRWRPRARGVPRALAYLAALAAPLAAGGPAAAGGSPTLTVRAAAPPLAPQVGMRILRLVDPGRTIRLRGRAPAPRELVTEIRYPAPGAGQGERIDAAPALGAHMMPLIVFGHGFRVTPARYAALLDAWARAGYVVAAPRFPRAVPDARGGPDENDIVNQPADMSFVITRLLALSARPEGWLHELLDPSRIAVAGHSDGAETALAVAYDRFYRDPRVDAAVILSGADFGDGGLRFAAGAPPLLASLGTADTINAPRNVLSFFGAARRPKYLLRLLGAGHLAPYSSAQRWLPIVEGVTTAFFDGVLRGSPQAYGRLVAAGDVAGRAALRALP